MAKIIFIVIVVVLVATFSTMNQEKISLRYFFGWEIGPFPVFVLILAALLLGMVLGFLPGFSERWKLRTEARRLEKMAGTLQKEIETLAKRTASPRPTSPSAEEEKKVGS